MSIGCQFCKQVQYDGFHQGLKLLNSLNLLQLLISQQIAHKSHPQRLYGEKSKSIQQGYGICIETNIQSVLNKIKIHEASIQIANNPYTYGEEFLKTILMNFEEGGSFQSNEINRLWEKIYTLSLEHFLLYQQKIENKQGVNKIKEVIEFFWRDLHNDFKPKPFSLITFLSFPDISLFKQIVQIFSVQKMILDTEIFLSMQESNGLLFKYHADDRIVAKDIRSCQQINIPLSYFTCQPYERYIYYQLKQEEVFLQSQPGCIQSPLSVIIINPISTKIPLMIREIIKEHYNWKTFSLGSSQTYLDTVTFNQEEFPFLPRMRLMNQNNGIFSQIICQKYVQNSNNLLNLLQTHPNLTMCEIKKLLMLISLKPDEFQYIINGFYKQIHRQERKVLISEQFMHIFKELMRKQVKSLSNMPGIQEEYISYLNSLTIQNDLIILQCTFCDYQLIQIFLSNNYLEKIIKQENCDFFYTNFDGKFVIFNRFLQFFEVTNNLQIQKKNIIQFRQQILSCNLMENAQRKQIFFKIYFIYRKNNYLQFQQIINLFQEKIGKQQHYQIKLTLLKQQLCSEIDSSQCLLSNSKNIIPLFRTKMQLFADLCEWKSFGDFWDKLDEYQYLQYVANQQQQQLQQTIKRLKEQNGIQVGEIVIQLGAVLPIHNPFYQQRYVKSFNQFVRKQGKIYNTYTDIERKHIQITQQLQLDDAICQ